MNKDEMKHRTKQYALRIIKLVEKLPKTRTSEVIGRQLLRSGTSVGANYRSACRAKSRADFISKMGTVEEETDESIYWMELLAETGLINLDEISDLLDEGNQIVAITISSIRTTKKNKL
jgi:four helix bundle protein